MISSNTDVFNCAFKVCASFAVHSRAMIEHRSTLMLSLLRKLWRNENGATAVEYGLICALIAVSAVSAYQLTGSNMSSTFHNVAAQL
jgi:pilus assembly protein Flp/PilA